MQIISPVYSVCLCGINTCCWKHACAALTLQLSIPYIHSSEALSSPLSSSCRPACLTLCLCLLGNLVIYPTCPPVFNSSISLFLLLLPLPLCPPHPPTYSPFVSSAMMLHSSLHLLLFLIPCLCWIPPFPPFLLVLSPLFFSVSFFLSSHLISFLTFGFLVLFLFLFPPIHVISTCFLFLSFVSFALLFLFSFLLPSSSFPSL